MFVHSVRLLGFLRFSSTITLGIHLVGVREVVGVRLLGVREFASSVYRGCAGGCGRGVEDRIVCTSCSFCLCRVCADLCVLWAVVAASTGYRSFFFCLLSRARRSFGLCLLLLCCFAGSPHLRT